MSKEECVFCKILAGKLPGSFVYRDAQVSAFLDIHPINPGHVLVIPNEHYEILDQIPTSVFSKMATVAQEINRSLPLTGVSRESTNLFMSDGKIAGQEVPHAHLHIVPRFEGDGHQMGFSGADPHQCLRKQLDATAEKICEVLDNGIL